MKKLKEPLVSFVMPAHNADNTIAEAINSCLTQSIKNIEVIVVNDRSDDDTEKIVSWYLAKDERVRALRTSDPFGVGAARNLGNRHARAEVICAMDSDDVSEKHRAEISYDMIHNQKHPFIYGSAITIDFLCRELTRLQADTFDPIKALKEKANGIVHSTMAYTKDLALQFPYDEGKYAAVGMDDWHLQLRLMQAKIPFAFTPKILLGYRLNLSGFTATRSNAEVTRLKDKFLEELGLLEKI